MSVTTLTPQKTRKKNLIRIAWVSMLLSFIAAVLYIYLGNSSHNLYNYLVSGSFFLITFVSVLLIRTGKIEHPKTGTWHLIFSIILTALFISAVQSNIGAEIGSATLIIILVLVIQTIPPEQALRGAALSAVASLACSLLAFYSPISQTTDATADLIITWVARGTTLVFLALIIMQFRSLNLANKLLISFLGVVVAISMAFNIVMSSTTTNTLTNQIGRQLQSEADGRSIVTGDYLNGQLEVLQTLALNETIRQSVRAANALNPDLAGILKLDEQWRQAVASGKSIPLINSRLSNSLSKDLGAFQSLSPDHVEVFVTDRAGALLSATNLTSDYYQADENWWISTYQDGTGDVYISQPEFDESVGKLSILMSVPIYDTRQGGLIGILRSTISIDGLISVLDDSIGETGEADLFFPDGTILDTKQVNYEELSPVSLDAIQESANKVFLMTTFEGSESILAQSQIRSQSRISKINDLGWSVIVSQDTDEALAPVNEQVRLSSLFGTIMASVSALLSLLIAQRLAKPIVNLTETANKITRGDLEARAKVDSQDEIGQLSESFNTMTAQLQETLQGLEANVAERTAELEESSRKLQKRAEQFESIAQLARTITSIQDLDKLLPRIAHQVSQQFGFYHVGLFLLDVSRQYAVLSAANSDGGQRMLARKHRLAVGQTGIVGYVTSTGNPRIALDTGADAVYFDNPDLPDTRSEMALPLRVGEVIVGALDVQSIEPNAFLEDDVEVLSILADEVSVAIENARLFEESQRVLLDAQSAFGEYTRTAWQNMMTGHKVVGYELSGASIHSLEEPIKGDGSSTSIPIKLREQVIGTMKINLPENKELDTDEVDITQALAQRIGNAIETATLLEETRKVAAKEQIIGEISGKIGSSINLRNVLQTAVEELGHAIPGSEVVIQLNQKPGSETN
ncbi:MAG: GAF domain-containing protein [Anaerolineales bacterium]